MKSDDALRQRIKHLQSQNINELTMKELDEFVDGLRLIDSKLLYQKEVLETAVIVVVSEYIQYFFSKLR